MRLLLVAVCVSGCASDPMCGAGIKCEQGRDLAGVDGGADLVQAPDLLDVPDLARLGDAAGAVDMTCVPVPGSCPPNMGGAECATNCGGGLGNGGICDQNDACQPCGRIGDDCCINSQCVAGSRCSSSRPQDWGKFSRCEDANCGAAGSGCCYQINGNVLEPFCVNGAVCVLGTNGAPDLCK